MALPTEKYFSKTLKKLDIANGLQKNCASSKFFETKLRAQKKSTLPAFTQVSNGERFSDDQNQ